MKELGKIDCKVDVDFAIASMAIARGGTTPNVRNFTLRNSWPALYMTPTKLA
jgi:hypothetical protein